MKRWIAGLTAVLLIFCLAACGKDKTEGRSFNYPLSAEPKSLDPQICGDADTAVAVGNLYEGLVRLGEDGKILPGVAKTMEVSDDGLQYTFHLRENAKWHIIRNFKYIYGEGCEKNLEMPVTAEDFVFTFQRIFSAITATPGADTLYAIRNARAVHEGKLTMLELGVRAADAQTLVIELEKISSDLLTLLADGTLLPCRRLPLPIGNCLETDMLTLYRNSPLIRELQAQRIPDECSSCAKASLCRGGAKCLTYALTGDYTRKDPNCYYPAPGKPAEP